MKSFKNLFAAFLLVIFAFTFTSKAFAADKTVKVENNYAIKSEDKKSNPIKIRNLKPIQMPHVDINELKEGRKAFTKEEWMDILLRSIGMVPDQLSEREKWLLLLRLVPLVENNYNLCELGPRSTGKSHIYKEISVLLGPNSQRL